jgi:hypothetical protein
MVTSVAGTGAVSSASLDRGISVAVAPPEDALVGLSEPLVTTVPDEDGTRADLLTVTNRLGSVVDLTVTVAEADVDGGPNVTAPEITRTLASGASRNVTAHLSCDGAGTEAVTVSLTATGEGVRVEGASRTFDLTCPVGSETDDDGEADGETDEREDDSGEEDDDSDDEDEDED